jgi:predicted O-methyltransferase YrrM
MAMHLISDQLESYIEEHTSPEGAVLQSLDRETNLKIQMPQMLSGKVQGNLLRMISQMIQPRYILEIGTFTGYSAICLAAGLQPGGRLITLDINEELETMVRRYFKDAGVEDKIDYRIGNALELVPGINVALDLVFIDADKANYSRYYDLVWDKVRPGGYILADNVLWSGKILDEKPDKDTRALQEFNDKVQNDPRAENVILSVRDGIMMVRKKPQ